MPRLMEGIIEAFTLIAKFDPSLMEIVALSLRISGAAIAISALAGVPLGTFLGLKPEKRTRFISKILYTFMGVPPVVAGLAWYVILSRSGPLGVLGMLHTTTAMVLAQVSLALPIIAGLSMVGIRNGGKEIEETARTLGAGRLYAAWTVIRESRIAIFGAVVTGFGRIVAEVGAVMMVGGNIEHHTRVMTTAIVLETSKGHFGLAMGLGIILLAIFFVVNSLLYNIQRGAGSNF